jgi:hypothetical protein
MKREQVIIITLNFRYGQVVAVLILGGGNSLIMLVLMAQKK